MSFLRYGSCPCARIRSRVLPYSSKGTISVGGLFNSKICKCDLRLLPDPASYLLVTVLISTLRILLIDSRHPLVYFSPNIVLFILAVLREPHLFTVSAWGWLVKMVRIHWVLVSSWLPLLSAGVALFFSVLLSRLLAPFMNGFALVVQFYFALIDFVELNFGIYPLFSFVSHSCCRTRVLGLLAWVTQVTLKVSLLHKDFLELCKIH